MPIIDYNVILLILLDYARFDYSAAFPIYTSQLWGQLSWARINGILPSGSEARFIIILIIFRYLAYSAVVFIGKGIIEVQMTINVWHFKIILLYIVLAIVLQGWWTILKMIYATICMIVGLK